MTELPEWVATLVGRLQLENELLRHQLAELAQRQVDTNGHVPVEEPAR